MKLDQVANSKNDEFYTPMYAIKPLLKYIPDKSVIWCPFDTVDSNFVKILTDEGHAVIHSHINDRLDFFELINIYPIIYSIDYIISNPPYSMKTEVLSALFDSRIPFAMLLGIVGLFESQSRFNLFSSNHFEIMYFNKRISYMKDFTSGKTQLNPPFSSAFVCSSMLPEKIVFEKIVNKEDII